MDSIFSSRLREAIASKGMTKPEVARVVGVQVRAVQFWCAGQKDPRGRQLAELCRLLDRTAEWFYGLENLKEVS